MSHHHKTMEVGGWTLLLAAIAFLLYLLFHKDGQAALTGGTVVSSNIISGTGQVTSTGPPAIVPNDPTAHTSYMDSEGTLWTWNPAGKQWTVSGATGTSQARFKGALSFLNSVV